MVRGKRPVRDRGLKAVASEICDVCRALHARNLLAASNGNVSVRLADGRVVIAAIRGQQSPPATGTDGDFDARGATGARRTIQ